MACQIDYLCELNSDKERRKALDSLPPTLSETYKRILTRVQTSNIGNQRIVQRALKWIAYARRPLSLCALAEAISLEAGDERLDPEAIIDTNAVLKWCSSLVRLSSINCPSTSSEDDVGRDNSIIELAHFTVKEFLAEIDPEGLNGFQKYSLKTHEMIEIDLSRTCLTYLCLDNFAETYPRTEEEYQRTNFNYPLYYYAANYWMDHGEGHFDDDIILTLSHRLFNLSKSNNFMHWAQAFYVFHNPNRFDSVVVSLDYLVDSSPLHWACLIANPELCRRLIGEGADVNKNSRLGHPLHSLIVESSVLFNSREESYRENDDEAGSVFSVLELLIDAGANLEVNDFSLRGCPTSLMTLALMFLFYKGCALLIEKGAILDREALKEILSDGHCDDTEGLVDLVDVRNLLARDTTWFMEQVTRGAYKSSRIAQKIKNINSIEFNLHENPSYLKDLNNTLMAAAESGQEEIVKNLIQNIGLNVNLTNSSNGKSLLHLATSSNFSGMIVLLLSLRANPFQTDKSGATPLHLAARHRDCGIFQILLKVTEDVSIKDNQGLSALHIAACHGNILAINALHNCNLILDEHYRDQTKDGRTLLLCAAQSGSVEAIEFFINSIKPTGLSKKSHDGSAALHYSAQSLSPSATRYFLQRGIHVDEQKSDKSTALHIVAATTVDSGLLRAEKRQVLEILLDSKANINAQRADGKTALHLLCEQGHETLYDRGHEIFDERQKKTLEGLSTTLLLDRGARVDITDDDGCTPLHRLVCQKLLRSLKNDSSYASWRTLELRIKDFLEQGSDASLENHSGASPISVVLQEWRSRGKASGIGDSARKTLGSMLNFTRIGVFRDQAYAGKQFLNLAIEIHDEELVDRLLYMSCDVDKRDQVDEQYNALEQACHTGCSAALLTRLIKLSKNKWITLERHQGLNLLHIAITSGHDNLVNILLDHGFGIDDCTSDQYGKTALMLAAERPEPGIIRILLRRKADKTIQSKWGLTALHCAANVGNLEAVQLLELDVLPSQARIQTYSGLVCNGLNPFHLAVSCGYHEIADYFLATYQDLDVNDVAGSKVSGLHLAATDGETLLVKHLLSIGAIVDATDDNGQSALHYASQAGHRESVLALLEHGADSLLRDHCGMTPEILALQYGHQSLAKTTFNHKDVQCITSMEKLDVCQFSKDSNLRSSGQTSSLLVALFQAIERHDIEFCEKLIDAGANPNGTNPTCGRCTPLLVALEQQQRHIAEFLIRKGAQDEGATCDQHDAPGATATLYAANFGYADIIQNLLIFTEDRMCKESDLVPLVQCAAANGHLECVKVLLDFKRANNNVCLALKESAVACEDRLPILNQRHEDIVKDQDSLNKTTLERPTGSQTHKQGSRDTAVGKSAIYPRHLEQSRLPMKLEGSDQILASSALHGATASNSKDIVTFLIDRGAHLETRDSHGFTLLHVAARMGLLEMTKMLIDYGANVDARTTWGETAAMNAARNGHLDILYTLSDRNADLALKDCFGKGVVDHAIGSGSVLIISCLMALGQKPCWSPQGFCLPLCASLSIDSPELHSFLLDFMPDYSVECEGGFLLLDAIRFKRLAFLRKLAENLQRKGLSHILNKSNETRPPALCIAAFAGSIDYIQPLLEANADIEVCWGHYDTPLGAACLAGHLEAIRYLIERGAKTSWIGSNGKLTTAVEKAKDHKHIVRWLRGREGHIPQNKAIQTVNWPAISRDQAVLQAEKILPRLRNHLPLADNVQKPTPTNDQYIRRRGSFILEYALCQTTTPPSPAPQRIQMSAKQRIDPRQPILSPDWGVTIRRQNESVYISAIIRNTCIVPPRQYKLSPLAKRIYQVKRGSAWELF